MDELQKKVIVISEITDKEKQLKIKGDDNRTYSLWKNKQDGSETVAIKYFKENSLSSGSKVGIAYKDNQWTSKDGKQITSHNIVMFTDANDIQYQSQNLPRKTNTNDAPDWDKIAEGKVRHGLVCALIQAGKDIKDIELVLPAYEDMVMNGVLRKEAKQEVEDALDVEQINTDNIPF